MAITTTTMAAPSHEQSQKQPTVLKKVLKYFQNQAVQQSQSRTTFLSPPGQEPQQRIRHRSPTNEHDTDAHVTRTFSDATTAVEPRRLTRMAVAGGGVVNPRTSVGTRDVSAMSQSIKKIQYGHENLLQSYELYVPESKPEGFDAGEYWVLFIHGGYFRDPKTDATTFRPALKLLTEDSPSIVEESESSSNHSNQQTDFFAVQRQIAGYASINYRLSPHERYPQDPESTPNYELRNASYPDQLDDVHAAIRHLQSRHHFGSKYILAGHSVGATLAFLAALKSEDADLDPPKCVVGLNGIYDFPNIHKTNPDYEAMTRNAMKTEQYQEASPALYPPEDYSRIGKAGTDLFLLSHSRDDGLVVWDQVELMQEVLNSAQATGSFDLKMLETKGSHDDIWRQGKELARVIREAVELVGF